MKFKYFKCVHHVKDNNEESNSEETKDARQGRSMHYRIDETPNDVFQQRLDDELSGRAEVDNSHRLDDVWIDVLRKQKNKEKEPVMAFTIVAKK